MKKFQDEAYGYIKDMFAQHHMVKRVVLSLISIIVMGFGISLFSLSGFGVDPFTSMNMNVASTIGMGFGTYQLIINLVILAFVVIVAHRGLVGVGTIFNMVGCGYSCEFFQNLFAPMVNEHYTLALRVPLLLAGIVTLCFACSLFFTANVGVGPYDALSFMLARSTKFQYKWMRVATGANRQMKKFQDEAYGYIKDMFAQHHMVKRVVLSLISIIVMGFGISLFSLSGFGVDPFTSMNMNVASTIGMGFGTYQLIINLVILAFVVIVAHRGLVGVGTIFNMVGCGYSCEFFQNLFAPMVNEHYTLALRVPLLLAGIVTLCFACSLFFTANVGVGPYDALSFMLARSTKFQYKWMRVATDVTVVLIGLIVSGGVSAIFAGDISKVKNIGIGTIITAFCMGPLINVFNKYVSAKIFNVDYEKISKNVAFFMLKGAMVKNSVPNHTERTKFNNDSTTAEVLSQSTRL